MDAAPNISPTKLRHRRGVDVVYHERVALGHQVGGHSLPHVAQALMFTSVVVIMSHQLQLHVPTDKTHGMMCGGGREAPRHARRHFHRPDSKHFPD